MPRSSAVPRSDYQARVLARQETVRVMLQALTASGLPVSFETLAARCDLSGPEMSAALLKLDAMSGSGPLFIDGGYVWVHIGPEAQAAD